MTKMSCVTQQFPISRLYVEANIIDDSPDYQRESAIWSKEKQQLFIDSIFHEYDIPKIYFHDLRSMEGQLVHFAIIDGKQRLFAVHNFLGDGFPLAEDFEYVYTSPEGEFILEGGPDVFFSQIDPFFQTLFQSRALDVVLVRDADEEDIEELFSRLNNGEPLTAAEKRNAIGGDMTKLVREIAQHKFFTERIKFQTKRRQDYEAAVKLLILEDNEIRGAGLFCDLKKKFLDDLVKTNRSMSSDRKKKLSNRVSKNLNRMERIFARTDPLLRKQAYVPLYYLFVKSLAANYGAAKLTSKIKAFLAWFTVQRVNNNQVEEESRDVSLVEFGRLMQQGTNDKGSLETRVSILTRHFLLENPDVKVKDRRRYFTPEERYVIYEMAGHLCSECEIHLEQLSDMHADHIHQHSFAGETTLRNARSLCAECNERLAQSV